MTATAFLRDQLMELAQQGWDVHLVTSPDPGFEELFDLTGVTVHALPMRRNPSPIKDLYSFFSLRRLIRDLHPDAVVASTPKAGLLGMLAARQQRVPTRLYHVRGLRAEGLKGFMLRISLGSERLAGRASTDIICDSLSLRDAMEEAQLLPTGRAVVLGSGSCCGVNTKHFRPGTFVEKEVARASFGFASNNVVIGYVGRIARDKGVAELLQAVRATRATYPDVRLALVGPLEDQDLKPSIDSAVNEGWVIAPGSVADPRPSYWAFDVFCLPSHREGFPVSPLEAQACGLPVVTTTATGCRDSIVNGTTGLLVSPNDVPALHLAVTALVTNAGERERMGRSGSEWIRSSFEQADVRRRFINYLVGLVQQKSPHALTD